MIIGDRVRLRAIEEGRLRKHRTYDRKYFETILMSILREEWEKGLEREKANG